MADGTNGKDAVCRGLESLFHGLGWALIWAALLFGGAALNRSCAPEAREAAKVGATP